MTKFVSTAIAAALLAAAGAAQAQPAGESPTVIHVDDVNLRSAGGLAIVEGRVKTAANRACGRALPLPLKEAQSIADCREQLFRSAADQLASVRYGRNDVLGTR